MSLLIGFLPGLARLFARPLCSLFRPPSLSLSPAPSSSTSNVATSFHPRKRAKLPQVLYLLCLATLVSTHKHGSPLHFSSLAHASSNVVLILSAVRSVSVPRRLFSPLLARIHEFERVLRLGVQNLERTVGIVYRGIYPTLLSTPQPLLIYLLNNTTSLLLLGSSLLSLVRSICLSFHLFSLFPTRSRVTFVADGPLLFRRRRRRRFAFRMEGGGDECRSRRTNEGMRFSDYGKREIFSSPLGTLSMRFRILSSVTMNSVAFSFFFDPLEF